MEQVPEEKWENIVKNIFYLFNVYSAESFVLVILGINTLFLLT
jgi:hypothetical protein